MDPKRWSEIKELYQKIFDCTKESQRARIFDEYRSRDPDLVEKVLGLLSSADDASNQFDLAPAWVISSALHDRAEDWVGLSLGPYKVERCIGSGGMGIVYEAKRVDGQYDKRVAVKRLHPGHLSDNDLRRFRREGRLLSALDHPNIARLIDAGDTEGQPYLILEFVDGIPIDAYCDEHNLAPRERLNLFRTICAAVHHAHKHLIVHRDLKTSNILVDHEGCPKLLDFGIARPLNSVSAAKELTGDQAGMTPGWASPEQIQGLPTSTADDIYALGILLYRLIADNSPFDLSGLSPYDAAKRVCETDPKPPSLRNRKSNKVSPDLDAICLKALARNLEERYGSAAAFSEDIFRYLRRYTVSARPHSIFAPILKFVRRNRIAVAVAFIVFSALGVSVGAAILQGRLASRASAAAIESASMADSTSAFLIDIITSVDPGAEGPNVLFSTVLESAGSRLRTSFSDQPQIQARLCIAFAQAFMSLGDFPSAQTLLQRAQEIQLSEVADDEDGDEESLALARSLLGNVLYHQHRPQEALPYLEQAVGWYEHSSNHRTEVGLSAKNNLAVCLRAVGRSEEAMALHKEVLHDREMVLGTLHQETAESLNNIANIHFEAGRFGQAESFIRRVLEIRRHGGNGFRLAQAMHNLAMVIYRTGQASETTELFEEAIILYEQHAGSNHPELAATLFNYGVVLSNQGKLEEALTHYRRAMKIRRKALNSPDPVLALTAHTLGVCLASVGQVENAEPYLVDAVEQMESLDALDHPNSRKFIRTLISFLETQGQYDKAALYQDLQFSEDPPGTLSAESPDK